MTEPTKSGISRRTLAKGAAWSVPAAAVVAAAPAYAVSIPEPVIDFGNACGNTGATQKGCGGKKTLQVPLTLSNNTNADIVFQITSMYTCNCATAPTAAGAGVYSGVRGIWATPSHTVANQNKCTAPTGSTCAGAATGTVSGAVSSVVVPAGATNKTYWIESVVTNNSSNFATTINWRLLTPGTPCTVLDTGMAKTTTAISPQNCDGANK